MLYRLVRASHLDVIFRLQVTLNNNDRAGHLLWLELISILVVSHNRNIQLIAFLRITWDGSGDFTCVLVDGNFPLITVFIF